MPPSPSYSDNKEIIKLKTKDGVLISAVYLPNKNAKYTVLVSHGNAEDLGHMMPFLKQFRDHGFSVFAYDYRSYGTSMGKPTEANTYLDIDAAYNYLISNLQISPNRIILYGRSVGTAPAIELASQKTIAGLIIESPFLSAYRAVTQIPLFLFDKYNNFKKIKKIKHPVLVIHGKQDREIPFWQGEKLYNEIDTQKYFLWLENAGHNDILIKGRERYWQAIIDFGQKLNHI